MGAGVQVDSLGGGAFTLTTMPNLAMSVPLAELRLRHQRRERADAAASRAKASGELQPSSRESAEIYSRVRDPPGSLLALCLPAGACMTDKAAPLFDCRRKQHSGRTRSGP